jgi:hypothetical protein
MASFAPHFPGSLPFDNAVEGFVWAGRTLGDRVRRVPDGETEPTRRMWQPYIPWFDRNPTLDRGEDLRFGVDVHPQFMLKEGVEPVFDEPFDYQSWARDSYAVFKRIRDRGGLPAHARYMVAMPSGIDQVCGATAAESYRPMYDAFVKQLKVSLDAICGEIPHEDLAIQLDSVFLPVEWMGESVGVIAAFGLNKENMLRDTMVQVGWIPEDVEVGFHLCFGDGSAEGHVEDTRDPDELPSSIEGLVDLSNDLVKSAPRKIDFLNLSTYQHWTDAAPYESLRDLEVGDTEISLGVICMRRDPDIQTGIANARKRTEAARSVIGDHFGIATTCGMGRFTPDQTEAATQLYDELQPR